jgi:hypothetical protein
MGCCALAAGSAYFSGPEFVLASLRPESFCQVRVRQVAARADPKDAAAKSLLMCCLGGEVRRAAETKDHELRAASGAAGAGAGASASEAVLKHMRGAGAGRPLKCSLVCAANRPIILSVYSVGTFVPTVRVCRKARRMSDSRVIEPDPSFSIRPIQSK